MTNVPDVHKETDTFRDYLIDEFVEDYQEQRLTRRDALKKLTYLTGSVAAASTLLAACSPAAPAPAPSPTADRAAAQPSAPPAPAAQSFAPVGPGVSPSDPDIDAAAITFPGQDGAALMGYLARPQTGGPYPIVLVCHENRGLVDYTRDVARRLGKAGFVALAVDLLSRLGGADKIANRDTIPGLLGRLPADRIISDFQDGMRYLQAQSYTQNNQVGMVGFCFGGGVTWRVALQTPEISAAVPFYGPVPTTADVSGIQAAVLGIYAGNDSRINAGIERIEPAMKQANKTFEKIIYPDVGHAFHNDTGRRYAPEAAAQAWEKTHQWFEQYLKG